MTHRTCNTAVLVMMALGMTHSGTQAQQRDAPSAAVLRTGTASVAGTVVLPGDTPVAVRRAVVTLSAVDGRDHRSAVTDDAGRFHFSAVPAGRYTIEARKAAHLTMSYGAKRPGRPGTSVPVAEGQSIGDLTLQLPRGGVIAGRLILETGDPLPDTEVQAIPVELATAGGISFPSDGAEFRSNDEGEFRIYGLPPGRYLLAAYPQIGRGEIERSPGLSFEAAVASIPKPGGALQPSRVHRTTYAATYYPGTPVAADATTITIAAGDVKAGHDMTVMAARTATITGVATDRNGLPTNAVVLSIELVGPPLPIRESLAVRTRSADAQGRFAFTNVPPGLYRISAQGGGVYVSPTGSLSVKQEEQTDWARTDVLVQGADIDNVALALQPGMEFSGQFATEGPTAAPATWAGTRITIRQVRPVGQLAGRGSPGDQRTRTASVTSEGAFRVSGVTPGEYEVQVTLPQAVGRDWALASILHNEQDVRDVPLTFARGSLRDVRVVLTTQRTELSGTLTSESGAPAAGYYIVAFPTDRALWHAGSPRLRVIRPSADGSFSARDLPPGIYRIAALVDLEDDEHRRPEFLESIYESAITVTIAPGTGTRQDIRIR